MSELVYGGLLLVSLIGMLWAFTKLERVRAELKRTKERLGSYLPPHVVSDVLARGDNLPRAKIHARVTVVVFRIRNFANLIERLDPATALRYINECYLLCGTAVNRNGGAIERFIENGVVGVFGLIEGASSDHEYCGIRAGLEAARLVSAMAARWENEGRRPLRLAVGIHSGPIVAGDVGFGDRRSFALVGNTVSVAYQLQDVCEEINASVVASAAAYEAVESRFVALPVKQMPLRHMHALHDTYIIRGLSVEDQNDELVLPTMPALTTSLEPSTLHEHPSAPIAREVGSLRRVSPLLEDAAFREQPGRAIVADNGWPGDF